MGSFSPSSTPPRTGILVYVSFLLTARLHMFSARKDQPAVLNELVMSRVICKLTLEVTSRSYCSDTETCFFKDSLTFL